MSSIPYLDAATVNRLLAWPALIDALRAAFIAPPIAPPRTAISYGEHGDRHFLVMPAVNPEGLIGVKLVSVHPALAARPGGAVRGLYVALDAATGEPRALIDGPALTERRTAAASVLAARTLARALVEPAASVLLVAGTGQVAHALCRCYAEVVRPQRIMVWGRRSEAAEALAARLAAEGISAEPVRDLGEAVRAADIVSVATLSTAPLIRGADVRPGTHIDLVGGFTPSMREADDALAARAVIVADGPGALETAGDLTQPIAAGLVDRATVKLLDDILAGRAEGRRNDDEITLFKSVGLALEDLAAAELLLARWRAP
ncbi:ornithine cyclodeaminase family protein [Sphingosinicella sp.]|uniref:ornithine cyclodeaminase family protein n=1 Tax=Sphingosinicella sp. TaxID=1917971 RepID=UPI0035ADC265